MLPRVIAYLQEYRNKAFILPLLHQTVCYCANFRTILHEMYVKFLDKLIDWLTTCEHSHFWSLSRLRLLHGPTHCMLETACRLNSLFLLLFGPWTLMLSLGATISLHFWRSGMKQVGGISHVQQSAMSRNFFLKMKHYSFGWHYLWQFFHQYVIGLFSISIITVKIFVHFWKDGFYVRRQNISIVAVKILLCWRKGCS